ncbi:uncharacterized protein A4U43_C05F34060 [Asparagus officinalis]|uniref:Pentacotripeptide-repeat region of PRORP domain-containing protein n=1 Tax=Asparagus officinalis TaxID=4686 RepID=A0A5P1F192_ASPOF|nr:pentatricopeptide repeat-containing protein At1g80880, mitochondrial [Asparagus officinalis]XP_020265769.1 pentatricopeptide repeat-containing protein At1g80880, mitochondrial [Asparagus officinalis]ONK70471.1 uncharacterized protein A4U43_C05F34060 [Asparagus officinalis]
MSLAVILNRVNTKTQLPLLLRSLLTSSSLHSLSSSDGPISSSDDPILPSLLNLITTSKTHPRPQNQALALLRSSPFEPTKGLVCSALWELRSDWESAVSVFKWARGSVEDWPEAWELMVWVLGNERRFDLAWGLVRRMHRKSLLTAETMVVLMGRYAAANEVSKAIKTFHAMEKFKIDADSATFYALLHALCKNKNVEEAEELLLLNRKFFPLETEGFNIILNGWCNIIVDLVEAKRVWREMSNCCIIPDGTSYSHMICCYSKVGNLIDSLRLYDQMKKRGWVPGLVIYNSLIYGLMRENCFKEARKTFDKILEAGLKPDIETYNSMIYPLCEARKVEEARDVFDDMIKNGIDPTIETYHAYAKVEDFEGTLELLKKMNEVGYGPDSYTFLLIFDKFFRLGESESALKIWSEMSTYNVFPDSSHYTKVVQGLVTQGWIPKAMEFYNEMKSKGLPGDPKLEKIFETFIASSKNHWGRGKDFIVKPCGQQNARGAKDVKIHEELGKMIF